MQAKINFKILDRTKKQKILKMLAYYRIEKLNYLLLQTNSKLKIFSGMLSKDELFEWLKNLNIDSIGLYFASLDNAGIRLNLDAAHLLAEQIKGNVLEIDDEQAEKWFHGQGIELNKKNIMEIESSGLRGGFIILKNREDIIGVGKLTQCRILNYMPKERRIKN